MLSKILYSGLVVAMLITSPALGGVYTFVGTLNEPFEVTADILLNSSTATADLVITGPADRWFAVGFSSFGTMSAGQVLVYSDVGLEDRSLAGYSGGSLTDPQTANLLSNEVEGNLRTLTIENWQINYFGDTFGVESPEDNNPFHLIWAVGHDMDFAYHDSSGPVQAVFVLVPEPGTGIIVLVLASALSLSARRMFHHRCS